MSGRLRSPRNLEPNAALTDRFAAVSLDASSVRSGQLLSFGSDYEILPGPVGERQLYGDEAGFLVGSTRP